MNQTENKAGERAVEIVNSYHNILAKRIPDMLIVKYEAKQCALIAVDREIQSFSNFFSLHYSKTIDMDITIAFSEHIKSLKAVRAEIEKL